jgi:hypothetical protein
VEHLEGGEIVGVVPEPHEAAGPQQFEDVLETTLLDRPDLDSPGRWKDSGWSSASRHRQTCVR